METMFILYSLLACWVLWYLYIIVMGLYRAKLAKRLSKPALILGSPAIIVGIVLDFILQYTVAIIYFRDLPVKGEYLITDRLQRYMSGNKFSKNYIKAKLICDHLLDPFDPTGKHC